MAVGKVVTLPLALAAAGCASSPVSTVQVPDNLKPGANEALALVVPAKGDQIYECRAKKGEAGTFEWAFMAPQADLFDRGGKKIGRHYAGPHWEAADGSTVIGAVKARADAPAKGDIPWLLLGTKSVGPDGAFSKVTSIQRVTTAGGVGPTGPCDRSESGAQIRVQYSADYYFFTAR